MHSKFEVFLGQLRPNINTVTPRFRHLLLPPSLHVDTFRLSQSS